MYLLGPAALAGAHDVVPVLSHVGQLEGASFVTVSLFEGHLGRWKEEDATNILLLLSLKAQGKHRKIFLIIYHFCG